MYSRKYSALVKKFKILAGIMALKRVKKKNNDKCNEKL